MLEGAATTREKARELINSGKSPKDKAEKMIINNYNAMLSIKDLMDFPLSANLIKNLQKIVTENTLHKGLYVYGDR